jgi:PST family polysaccharide transporter
VVLTEEMLIRTIHAVALPVFSRLQDADERLSRAFLRATQASAAVAVPAFIGMAVLAADVVRVCFGSQWDGAIPAMRVLAFAGIVQACTYFINTLSWARGKPGLAVRVSGIHAVGNVVGFLVAVHWGVTAVAVAFVVRGYVLLPLTLWWLRQLLPIGPARYLRVFVPTFEASAVMAVVVVALATAVGTSALNLALCVAVGAAVYSVSLRLVAPDLFRDLREHLATAIPGRRRSGDAAAVHA